MKPLYLTDDQARIILKAIEALREEQKVECPIGCETCKSSVKTFDLDVISILTRQALFNDTDYGDLPRKILAAIDDDRIMLDAFTRRNAEIKGVL